MRKVLGLLLVGWVAVMPVSAAEPVADGVVAVGTAADISRNRLSIGFVADDQGHLLVRMNAPQEALFVRSAQGAEYTARKVAYDSASGLSLLKIAGDVSGLKHYTFAKDPAELQRNVYTLRAASDLAASNVVGGTLASVEAAQSSSSPSLYLHNALAGEQGEGAPLLNNCGEVVGVVVPKPGFLSRLFGGDDAAATAYAVPAAWVLDRFGAQGLSPVRAAVSCLSEAAQAEAQRQAAEAERQEREAAEAKAAEEARKAQAAADRAAEEERRAAEAAAAAEAAQAELDELRRQMEAAQGATEEERQRLQTEMEERQRAIEAARAQEAAALEAKAAAERAAAEREQQYMLWGIVAGAVLLLLILLVWVLKQRSLAREREEKAAAEVRAQEAAANAEAAQADLAAREQDEARIRQTPNVFFEGADSAGQAIALRIPGASIAAPGGAVVGRNPSDSDFVINHMEVSRRHFRLFSDGRLLMVEDLGSTNGTTVDGKALSAGQETVLVDQSQVALGELRLSVRLEQN